MNKWERLADCLSQISEGVTKAQELHTADPQVRGLLNQRIPILVVPGAFGVVQDALANMAEKAIQLSAELRKA